MFMISLCYLLFPYSEYHWTATVSPVNNLKSNGFLNNLSYENNERTQIDEQSKIIKLFILIMQEICCREIWRTSSFNDRWWWYLVSSSSLRLPKAKSSSSFFLWEKHYWKDFSILKTEQNVLMIIFLVERKEEM